MYASSLISIGSYGALLLLCSAALTLMFGFLYLSYVHDLVRSRVREYTPNSHQVKNNTPTMGGIFMIAAIMTISTATCFWSSIPLLCALILFGMIGLWDDLEKVYKKIGISAAMKFIPQWIAAFIVVYLLVHGMGTPTTIQFPFFEYSIELGFFYYFWAAFVIVACSNAVNITDGLDGLATSVLLPNIIFFSLMALRISELSIFYFGMIVCGALLGFLWYNRYPAHVFMGDVGSLSLGAVYATLALITKMELLIPIVGIIFFIEELSVMLQVSWYKRYKKRLFKMAPLHHHLELSGWKETAIVTLFSAVSWLTFFIVFAVFYFVK